jgi:hypothetical protein
VRNGQLHELKQEQLKLAMQRIKPVSGQLPTLKKPPIKGAKQQRNTAKKHGKSLTRNRGSEPGENQPEGEGGIEQEKAVCYIQVSRLYKRSDLG